MYNKQIRMTMRTVGDNCNCPYCLKGNDRGRKNKINVKDYDNDNILFKVR